MKKGNRKRIPRDTNAMVVALRKHVELLREYNCNAFEKGEMNYLGEVAAKLRLLVVESPHNRPLLLELMDRLHSRTVVNLNGPIERKQVTLREYLQDEGGLVRVSSGELVSLTNSKFVRLWSEQEGGAHEDWEHDEEFVASKFDAILINGAPPYFYQMRAIARTVLSVADRFLSEIEENHLC